MKLSVKLRPTVEGRSSEVSPPPPLFKRRRFSEGEDGDKEKTDEPLGERSSPSSESSRSATPPPKDGEDEEMETKEEEGGEEAPLDFSLKKSTTEDESTTDEDGCPTPNGVSSQDGPLDLSVPRRRSRDGPRQAKLSVPSSPWGYNAPKHSSPKAATPLWNGKVKPARAKDPSSPRKETGRQNPWQSQWMSRSGEQTRDVFTCVWCKESFRSLADMTVHMKQSPRCGMAGMQTPTAPAPPPPVTTTTPKANVVKENVSLPRKLVRGQDVWLGKGAEQTRQILKCMWCGQSFKTLADMTTHMRVTQHYTNIISQEQIISWRTPEDKAAAQSQVNAVLTCKVCDQAFGSLKELSYHMVKNSHYKEHILRSITEGGGRRRQTRERRKKSLPVRKLLELERMELSKPDAPKPEPPADAAKVSCEECTEKVDAKDFVQHIKNCAQGNPAAPPSPSPSSQEVIPQPQEESTESAGSTSVLNAIEKLIEKSFESKGRRNAVSTGILQRLGIDEEVYPPWHPSSSPSGFAMARAERKSPLAHFKTDDLSGSESRSRSSSTSEQRASFDEHLRLTFGLSARDVLNRVSTPRSASRSCSPVRTESPPIKDESPSSPIKDEPLPPPPSSVKEEPSPLKEEEEHEEKAKEELDRSATPKSEALSSPAPSPPKKKKRKRKREDSSPASTRSGDSPTKESGDHPLKELQKLLDKTDAHLSRPSLPATPGSILAFSWACSEASTSDSLMKCAFCDTHFISKGAYRHHLSKMHFVKDTECRPPTPKQAGSNGEQPSSPQPQPTVPEESPHSKFLKYTELAKQLSSKYV